MPTTPTTTPQITVLGPRPDVPLPGQLLDYRLIIASVVYTDEDPEQVTWTLLLLRPQSPYFQVVMITVLPDIEGRAVMRHGNRWRIDEENDPILNIVPAVDQYKEWGGDF